MKEKTKKFQTVIDSLQSLIHKLQETDNYYYQMGVSKRQDEKYQISNKFLTELIERFPESSLTSKARTLIKKNDDDMVNNLYFEAKSAHDVGQYQRSNKLIDELLSKFPKSKLFYKVKKIKATNNKKINEEEEARLKRVCDLELITWNWGIAYGGSFAEARGQIKNISDETLHNVEAIVSFYDKNGNFITSSSALIEFNPILAGQTSPFSVLQTYNRAMKSATIEFKFLMGGAISTYQKKK